VIEFELTEQTVNELAAILASEPRCQQRIAGFVDMLRATGKVPPTGKVEISFVVSGIKLGIVSAENASNGALVPDSVASGVPSPV